MKVLYKKSDGSVVGMATDLYIGEYAYISVCDEFSLDNIDNYIVVNGELRLKTPTAVTPRQAKLALLQTGLLDDVEAGIEAITDPDLKRVAQIEWEYAHEIRRDWPLLLQLAEQVGLTSEQVDELFRVASTL